MPWSALPALRRAALAAACAVGSPALAGTQALKLRYGISLIGLPIGSAQITGTVEPTAYRIEVNARLSGLASLMSSSRAAGTATGALAGGKVLPSGYATTSANSTMTRTVRMAMTAGTVTGVDIQPPFDPQMKRVPISEADKHNILDPLSAFVMTVPAQAPAVGPQACGRTLPVFDGGVRFDIVLSYVGTRHVKAKGYEGDAAVCTARYVPVSGQRVDSKSSQFMAENRNMEVWLAPLADAHVVFPFRISVKTMVGTAVIEAEEFTVDGAAHAAVR